MITKEEFLDKYNISETTFINADISWEELEEIYEDFSRKSGRYGEILNDFIKKYMSNLEKMGLYSIHSRVKDTEHVIAKIIRKRTENYNKYHGLNKNNYEKYLTDLIGVRGIILFKEQWKEFHNYIVDEIENNPKLYVEDSERDFDEDVTHCYIAEKPKAHVRSGDKREIYEQISIPVDIVSDRVYRAIHYIVKFEGVYLEIQIRTLPEESWGEVDHSVRYPYFQKEPILKEYTELLNRLFGLADEMDSFFQKMRLLQRRYTEDMEEIEQGKEVNIQEEPFKTKVIKEETFPDGETPYECLSKVIRE